MSSPVLTPTPSAPDDRDVVIAEIAKNAREVVRVYLSTYKGYRRIGLRVFAGRGTEAAPTRQGFAVTVAQARALITSLHDALAAAAEAWGDDGGEVS